MSQPTGLSDRALHRAGTDAIAAVGLAERAAERLDGSEADAFLARAHRHGPAAYVALSRLYAGRCDVDALVSQLLAAREGDRAGSSPGCGRSPKRGGARPSCTRSARPHP